MPPKRARARDGCSLAPPQPLGYTVPGSTNRRWAVTIYRRMRVGCAAPSCGRVNPASKRRKGRLQVVLEERQSNSGGVRVWRGVILGLALAPVNALWMVYTDRVRRGPYFTSISLLFNVIFCLIVLQLLNSLVRRLRPRWALTQSEMLGFYVTLAVGSVLAGMDMGQGLVTVMTTRGWFANPQNRWATIFRDYPPAWLQITDYGALRGFYEGGTTLYRAQFLRAWVAPVAWWSAFAGVLVTALLCLSTLFRKRWQEEERLSFPVAQIPLALMGRERAFFRTSLFWFGFGAAAAIDVVAGLQFLYPQVPALRTGITDMLAYFPAFPWRAAGWLPVTFYPAVIGLGFLLPTEILFSCWFFYFWWKLQPILSALWGWSDIPQFPYLYEQLFGAYMGIALGTLWLARRHLATVAGAMVRGGAGPQPSREAASHRAAAWGLVAALAFLVWFGKHAGMTMAGAASFFAIYFLLAVAVARVRAEFGSPVHDFHFSAPDYVIPSVLGSAHIARGNLGVFTLFFWFNRAYRGHPMPHQIEGLYLSHRICGRSRGMFWPMALAGLVGLPLGLWAYAHFAYRLGAGIKFASGYGYGHEAFNRLTSWVRAPTLANWPGLAAVSFGLAVCFLLLGLRSRFMWWPFHPVGYAIAGSWSINLTWLPMLTSWVCKVTILRYGGLGAYRKALPFFYGLVLGEVVVGCGWSLLSMALRREMWSFWGA